MFTSLSLLLLIWTPTACNADLFESFYDTVTIEKLDRGVIKQYKSSRSTAKRLLSNARLEASKLSSTKLSDEEAIAFMKPDALVEYQQACFARDEALSEIANFETQSISTRRRLTSGVGYVRFYNAVDETVTLTLGTDDTCSDATETLATLTSGEWYSNDALTYSDYLCASSTTYGDDKITLSDWWIAYMVTIRLGYADALELAYEYESWIDLDGSHMELEVLGGVNFDDDLYMCSDSTLLGDESLTLLIYGDEFEIASADVDDNYFAYDDDAPALEASDGTSIDISLYDNSACSGTALASTTLTVEYSTRAMCTYKSSDPTYGSDVSNIDTIECTEVMELNTDTACYMNNDDDEVERNGCENSDGSFYCCTDRLYGSLGGPDCASADDTCTNDHTNKKVAEALAMILIVIVVVSILGFIGCILCCCACIKGCPLYEKCCCAPKGSKIAQVEMK